MIGELLLLRGIPEANAKAHRGVWNKLAAGSYEARGKSLGLSVTATSVTARYSGGILGMRVFFYDIESKLPLGNATRCSISLIC